MTIYTNLTAAALRMLAKFGASATFTSTASGSYNPATGTASVTPATQAVNAVKVDYRAHEIDGTLIKQGDCRVIVDPSLSATPKPGDTITLNSVVWTVVSSSPIDPTSIVVIHRLQVRK